MTVSLSEASSEHTLTRYRTVVVDPPWQVHQPPEWNYGSPGGKPNRPVPYPTMSLEQIETLPVDELFLAEPFLGRRAEIDHSDCPRSARSVAFR